MSGSETEVVHLLRGSRRATRVWCAADIEESHTGSVNETTCPRCLRVALNHYTVRHEESWERIRRIMDRRSALW